MGNDNITIKEHFVPQVYLKGFSPEYDFYKLDRKTKCTVFYYDMLKGEQQITPVPVDSVCFKRNLYEFTGINGEQVYHNLLEKRFRPFETMFSDYRRKLESKAFNTDNYNTHCFLRKEEKVFWLTFIVIQILRSPKTLEEAEKLSQRMFEGKMNERQAKNFARLVCIPLYKEIDIDSPEAELLTYFLDPMLNMHFAVCVDEKGRFITSDKSLFIKCTDFPCEEYERVVFPITSKLCLILLGGKEKERCEGKNFLFPADDEICKRIFIDIASSSYEKIFANHILDSDELMLINSLLI